MGEETKEVTITRLRCRRVYFIAGARMVLIGELRGWYNDLSRQDGGGGNKMQGLIVFLLSTCIIGVPVCLLVFIIRLLMRKKAKVWGIAALSCVVGFFGLAIIFGLIMDANMTPEERAAYEQEQAEARAAKEAEEAAEIAAKEAENEQKADDSTIIQIGAEPQPTLIAATQQPTPIPTPIITPSPVVVTPTPDRELEAGEVFANGSYIKLEGVEFKYNNGVFKVRNDREDIVRVGLEIVGVKKDGTYEGVQTPAFAGFDKTLYDREMAENGWAQRKYDNIVRPNDTLEVEFSVFDFAAIGDEYPEADIDGDGFYDVVFKIYPQEDEEHFVFSMDDPVSDVYKIKVTA